MMKMPPKISLKSSCKASPKPTKRAAEAVIIKLMSGFWPLPIKDLKKEIEEGKFREDLYHRLAVILIKVPALNERRDDIPLLIEHFSTKIASEQGIAQKNFSKKAIELLKGYDWTGNVRELRNVVERLIILGGKEVSEEDVKLFASK